MAHSSKRYRAFSLSLFKAFTSEIVRAFRNATCSCAFSQDSFPWKKDSGCCFKTGSCLRDELRAFK
eukprot:scaffold6684_cov92-Amphora_coffeaeformis.AAC.1